MNKYKHLVESTNELLIEDAISKLIDRLSKDKDVNKFAKCFLESTEEELDEEDLDEGLIPQTVFDVLNRYILASPQNVYKLIEKLLILKGYSKHDIYDIMQKIGNGDYQQPDDLQNDIDSTIAKKVNGKNNSVGLNNSLHKAQFGT